MKLLYLAAVLAAQATTAWSATLCPNGDAAIPILSFTGKEDLLTGIAFECAPSADDSCPNGYSSVSLMGLGQKGFTYFSLSCDEAEPLLNTLARILLPPNTWMETVNCPTGIQSIETSSGADQVIRQIAVVCQDGNSQIVDAAMPRNMASTTASPPSNDADDAVIQIMPLPALDEQFVDPSYQSPPFMEEEAASSSSDEEEEEGETEERIMYDDEGYDTPRHGRGRWGWHGKHRGHHRGHGHGSGHGAHRHWFRCLIRIMSIHAFIASFMGTIAAVVIMVIVAKICHRRRHGHCGGGDKGGDNGDGSGQPRCRFMAALHNCCRKSSGQPPAYQKVATSEKECVKEIV